MLNIKPRASNAFDVELLIYKGDRAKVALKLEFQSDGKRLHVLCRDKKFKVTTVPSLLKTLEEKQLAITYNLTIEV